MANKLRADQYLTDIMARWRVKMTIGKSVKMR